MNEMLELPETVLRALEQQAAASGTTPQGWIAARLAEAGPANGQSPAPASQPLGLEEDASEKRVPADPIHSGFAEAIEADLRRLASLPNNWDRYGGIEEENSFPATDLERAAELIQWFMSGTAA